MIGAPRAFEDRFGHWSKLNVQVVALIRLVMYAPQGRPVDAERGQAQPQEGVIVVFGIPLEDERLAFLTHRVLVAASIVALLIILSGTIDLIAPSSQGSNSATIAIMLCSLSCVACGDVPAVPRFH